MCLIPPRPKPVQLLKLADVALKSWLKTESSRATTHANPQEVIRRPVKCMVSVIGTSY